MAMAIEWEVRASAVSLSLHHQIHFATYFPFPSFSVPPKSGPTIRGGKSVSAEAESIVFSVCNKEEGGIASVWEQPCKAAVQQKQEVMLTYLSNSIYRSSLKPGKR